jgi:hypothetical protein
MTADLTQRLGEIGAVLAEKMPGVLDATVSSSSRCHQPLMLHASIATRSSTRSESVVTPRCSWAPFEAQTG